MSIEELRETYQKAVTRAYQADEALKQARETYEQAWEKAYRKTPEP